MKGEKGKTKIKKTKRQKDKKTKRQKDKKTKRQKDKKTTIFFSQMFFFVFYNNWTKKVRSRQTVKQSKN
jgi:hypothetical protein